MVLTIKDDIHCPFCQPVSVLLSNESAMVIADKYPVTPGHLLIIPRRHIADFFELTAQERAAVNELLEISRQYLLKQYSPDGFNIGINCGRAAGQTVMHVHVHLIPRHFGDIDDPRGGVRGVIPDKQKY